MLRVCQTRLDGARKQRTVQARRGGVDDGLAPGRGWPGTTCSYTKLTHYRRWEAVETI